MTTTNNIGIQVAKQPAKPCTDIHCPYHGHVRLHGRTFVGTVVSAKAAKTATVAWERRHFIRKFERYSRRLTKLHVHNPPCINAVEGEKVKIVETRPLSKTKHFIIIEKVSAPHVRFVEHEHLRKKEKMMADEEASEGKKEGAKKGAAKTTSPQKKPEEQKEEKRKSEQEEDTSLQ
ncbi:30S ribosomal protein S17 [Candidatus Woesearchaeota archaeon]|nr:30S ribosomal protein S17 [Candidatus Woesearchaeota archaeon]